MACAVILCFPFVSCMVPGYWEDMIYSPTTAPSEHPEPAAQAVVSPRRRLHSLSGEPVPLLSYLCYPEVLPHVQREPPVLLGVHFAASFFSLLWYTVL